MQQIADAPVFDRIPFYLSRAERYDEMVSLSAASRRWVTNVNNRGSEDHERHENPLHEKVLSAAWDGE